MHLAPMGPPPCFDEQGFDRIEVTLVILACVGVNSDRDTPSSLKRGQTGGVARRLTHFDREIDVLVVAMKAREYLLQNVPSDIGGQMILHFFERNTPVAAQHPPAFVDVILVRLRNGQQFEQGIRAGPR